ncbi:MAG: hypothetical protein V4466_06215 [Pseudomonadota bacterium]
MKPRITINMADGELELWLNEAGRDLLVEQLKGLSARSDHLHLWTWGEGDLPLSDRLYRSTDKIVDTAKIMLRLDDWDREYFPHVMDAEG